MAYTRINALLRVGAIAAACQFVAGEPGCDADKFFYDALMAALVRAHEAFSGNQGVFPVTASACTVNVSKTDK